MVLDAQTLKNFTSTIVFLFAFSAIGISAATFTVTDTNDSATAAAIGPLASACVPLSGDAGPI